jgi:hypothetical protein
MANVVDFNFIINAGTSVGLSVETTLQLAYLIGLTKGAEIRLDTPTLNMLQNEGFINSSSIPLPKGLKVFRRLKIDNGGLSKELRNLYPPGMKDDKWPWRGTISSVSEKLDDFNKMYPDITDEEIIQAAKDYLNAFTEESGRSLLPYFIWKMIDGRKRSILAEWVYAKRESGEVIKTKNNIDQL